MYGNDSELNQGFRVPNIIINARGSGRNAFNEEHGPDLNGKP